MAGYTAKRAVGTVQDTGVSQWTVTAISSRTILQQLQQIPCATNIMTTTTYRYNMSQPRGTPMARTPSPSTLLHYLP